MKKYTFNNGETRLENQMREGVSFKEQCWLWGTFNKETSEPLPYTITEAAEEDLKADKKRRYQISEERAAAEYDDSNDFYICPNTGFMMDLQGNIIDDSDQNEQLKG